MPSNALITGPNGSLEASNFDLRMCVCIFASAFFKRGLRLKFPIFSHACTEKRALSMKLPDGYTPGVGVVKSSGFGGFGERMLKQFGWQKGRGLGKEEQGMSSAIEIRKKEDQIGVGFGPDRNWNAWWETGFEEAAKGVRVAASRGDGSDNSSDDSDDEGYKEKRSLNRDGTVATGSAQELRLLESLAKAGGRVATGRFGGRDAKMERIRRQEELEAQRMREKLGLVATVPQAPSGAGDGHGGKKRKSKDGDEKRKKAEKKGKKDEKQKKERKERNEKRKEKEDKGRKRAGQEEPNVAKKNRRIVIECGNIEAGVDERRSGIVAALRPTPSSGWWGCHVFRSAGAMDSSPLKKKTVDDKENGFSEEQQAKIYEAAQMGKTSGKTGLGKGKRGTIKIVGPVWKGSKLTFTDDQNIGDGIGRSDGSNQSDDGADGGKGKDDKLASADVGLINWNKVVKRVLRKSMKKSMKKDGGSSGSKGCKIKSLHKEILSHLGAEYTGISVDEAEVRVSVDKCIGAKRSSFIVSACGKYVSLSV